MTGSELRLASARIDESPGSELAAALWQELAERYGSEDEADGFVPEQLAAPDGVFLLAWLDGSAVGCGGIRRRADFDDVTGEIKRMYVVPEARGCGVGQAILGALESAAGLLDYRYLVLETGSKQPEAIALYETSGYERIEPYGVYKSSPLTRCFAKDLDAGD